MSSRGSTRIRTPAIVRPSLNQDWPDPHQSWHVCVATLPGALFAPGGSKGGAAAAPPLPEKSLVPAASTRCSSLKSQSALQSDLAPTPNGVGVKRANQPAMGE
jgi:hypothetical protein